LFPARWFEIASRRTWRVDLLVKRPLYARLGIKEYFLFDPEARYLQPALQGFRCRGGKSLAMRAAADGSLVSKELGLRLVPTGGMLRLIDVKTGSPILTRSEQIEKEREHSTELAAEVSRLQRLLRQRGDAR
jgi:hypothetical protein